MVKEVNEKGADTSMNTTCVDSLLSPFCAKVTGVNGVGSNFKQTPPGAGPVPCGSRRRHIYTGENRDYNIYYSEKVALFRQRAEEERARVAATRRLNIPTQARHFEQLAFPVPAKYLVDRDPNIPPAIPLLPLPRLPVSDIIPTVVPTKVLVAADPIEPAKVDAIINNVKSTLASDTVRLVKPATPAFKNFEMVSLTHIIETQFQHIATIQKMDMRSRRLAALNEARGMLTLKRQIEKLSPTTFTDVKKTLCDLFVSKKHEDNADYVERLADLLVKEQENDWDVVIRKLERFEEFWGMYKRVFAEEDEDGNLQEEEIYILGAKGKKADFVRCVKQSGITGAPLPAAPPFLPTSLEREVSHSSASSAEPALDGMVSIPVEQHVWSDCGT